MFKRVRITKSIVDVTLDCFLKLSDRELIKISQIYNLFPGTMTLNIIFPSKQFNSAPSECSMERENVFFTPFPQCSVR